MKRFDGDECKRCEEKEIEKQIDNYVLCQKCESDPCQCEKNYVSKKELKRLLEEMKCELPKDIEPRDFKEGFNHFLIYAGRANYNKALDDVIDVINNTNKNNIDPEKIGDAGQDGMPGSDLFTCKFCGTEFERSPSHKQR